jgi:hypothetical protein
MNDKQGKKYFILWGQLCAARGWNPTDNARRHAVHKAVFGYDLSHLAMDNRHTDRIYQAFRLMADDTNLDAALFFEDPDREERKRLIWRIKSLAPEAYVKRIAADVFKSIYWEDLNVTQLTWLRNTLNNRVAAQKRRAAAEQTHSLVDEIHAAAA